MWVSWMKRFIGSLARDRRGVLWLGGEDSGLIRYDPASGERFVFGMDLTTPDYIRTVTVQALLVDEASVVWVGHDLGVSLLDLDLEIIHEETGIVDARVAAQAPDRRAEDRT